MKKTLRYVFVALLAITGMGNAFAQGITIDFDENYQTLFPTITGVSSNESHDGDFTGATTSTAVQGYTVTVTPAEDAKTPSRIWGSSPRLRMYSGTFTVTGPNITNIEFVAGSNFNISGASTGTLTDKVWTGSANEVVFTIEKNTQLKQIIINGNAEPEPEPQPVQTEGQGTLDSPYTVADAIAVASALDNKATTDNVYVQGTVSSITFPFDVEHGTATFNISADGQAANEFLCYAVYYLENKSWVEGNAQIAQGDKVIIYGKLTNYNGIAETSSRNAYVYSLNGNTKNEFQPEPIVLIGDGTQANPYLASDLEQMFEDFYPAEGVWVKGVVIGTAKSGSALNEENVVSNLAIAVDAQSTYFVPVELKAQTDFRAQLNLVDNPNVLGQEILFHGQILKYFSVTGLKNLDTAIINGQTITGIENVIVGKAFEGAVYNVAGQKVSEAYKGLVIVNGKKVVRK